MREAKWISFSRRSFNSEEKLPRNCRKATKCACRDCEAIRSAMASACDKSSFPFKKARLVNSPGSAKRQPAAQSACKICC